MAARSSFEFCEQRWRYIAVASAIWQAFVSLWSAYRCSTELLSSILEPKSSRFWTSFVLLSPRTSGALLFCSLAICSSPYFIFLQSLVLHKQYELPTGANPLVGEQHLHELAFFQHVGGTTSNGISRSRLTFLE